VSDLTRAASSDLPVRARSYYERPGRFWPATAASTRGRIEELERRLAADQGARVIEVIQAQLVHLARRPASMPPSGDSPTA
jgi:hypothetical protein